jgi:hypothetical protein
MMLNETNLIYSKAALKRMWGLIYRDLSEIQVRPQYNAVWVYLPGLRPRYVSKKEFIDHFVEYRKSSATGLQVTQSSLSKTLFLVRNPKKNSLYSVRLEDQQMYCDCADFASQQQFLDIVPKCKHIYAIEKYLSRHQIAA